MNGSLYLFPDDPLQAPDARAVLAALTELHLPGTLLSEAPLKQVFSAGEGFARHVVYAGCSPYLRFEPEAPHDRDFCHLALLGPYEEPQVLTGENTVRPRCPHCRSRLPDWQQALRAGRLPCPACGRELADWAWDWRQHAARGRVFVELRNVFPGEASPSDQLLGRLREQTGTAWAYAWADMSPEP